MALLRTSFDMCSFPSTPSNTLCITVFIIFNALVRNILLHLFLWISTLVFKPQGNKDLVCLVYSYILTSWEITWYVVRGRLMWTNRSYINHVVKAACIWEWCRVYGHLSFSFYTTEFHSGNSHFHPTSNVLNWVFMYLWLYTLCKDGLYGYFALIIHSWSHPVKPSSWSKAVDNLS